MVNQEVQTAQAPVSAGVFVVGKDVGNGVGC